jgi:hypothetical protein
VVDVESFARRPLDLLDRVVDERERAEPQEIHLQQTDAVDVLHGPLRDDFVVRAFVERRAYP